MAPSPFADHREGWFVSLGVSPGLSAVGYSVLDFEPNGRAHSLDHDVFMGNRGAQLERARASLDVATVAQLMDRFRVHRKLLEVLCERHYPLVIAIGPQAVKRESDKQIKAACTAIGLMAGFFGIQVVYAPLDKIKAAFPREKLPQLVAKRLVGSLGSRDTRIVRAAAAAIYGATEVRSLPLRSAG